MANYNTNLKSWGATGTEPPDGYNYLEDEPPVDVFDNWKANNVINDLQHLINLTNDRVETDKGTTRPSSPESAHFFADTGTGDVEWWDSTTSSWSRALDATGDTMEGQLITSAGIVEDAGSDSLADGGSINSPTTTLRGYYDSDGTTSVTATSVEAALEHVANSDGSSVLDTRVQGVDVLRANSSGDVEVPNGQLSQKGNLLATRQWANNNLDNYNSWIISDGDGTAETQSIVSGETLAIIGGSQMATEMDSNGDIQINHGNTTSQGDVTTNGATVIDDIYIDGNGHIGNLNTENRTIDDWVNSGNSSNNNVDADTVDGNHASDFMGLPKYVNQSMSKSFASSTTNSGTYATVNLGGVDVVAGRVYVDVGSSNDNYDYGKGDIDFNYTDGSSNTGIYYVEKNGGNTGSTTGTVFKAPDAAGKSIDTVDLDWGAQNVDSLYIEWQLQYVE